jgi:DNA repair protein RecO
MSHSFEETTIVLRVVPFEDRHRIVTALSETRGKITAMANNAVNSRRFGSALQPFSAATWSLVEREGASLFRLDEAVLKKGFEGLRRHFESLCVASCFTEIMLKIAPENEASLDLFKLHSNALFGLEEKALAVESMDLLSIYQILNAYFAKLLHWNGTQPQIMKCLSCERSILDFEPDTIFRASMVTAGWVCPDCKSYSFELPDQESLPLHRKFLTLTQRATGDFAFALTHPIRKCFEVFEGNLEDQRNLYQLLLALLHYHVPGFDRAPMKSLSMMAEFKG